MIILLQGPSEIARISIAEKIVQERPDWRHIPVERVLDLVKLDEESSPLGALFGDDMLMYLACQCATQLAEEGMHSILSYEDASSMLEDLREDLGAELYAIHLGEDDEGAAGCDYVIEPKLSVKETLGLIDQLIEAVLNNEELTMNN